MSYLSNSQNAVDSAVFTTSVYEVIRKSDPKKLSSLLFPKDENDRHVSYIASTLGAMLACSPELDASAGQAIDLSFGVGVERLKDASWPCALGMRVKMPTDESSAKWYKNASAIFGCMCAL